MTPSTELCRAVIARHSKSFALASRLLPRESRDEASIVYAWCRRADDAVDLGDPSDSLRAVERLRSELASIHAGEAQHDPVLGAFQSVTRERGIPRDYADELLAGMAMDATGAVYPDLRSLLEYCFRVAGTVGLMMSHVMGVRSPRALRHAAHLGMAMQLTNICRDVREDWDRGRLYLPDDRLEAAGARLLRARIGRPMPDEARPAVAAVMRQLLELAEVFYASGDRGIPFLSRRSAMAVRAARLVYADIGRVILRQGTNPFGPRAVVSTPRKLLLAARAIVATLRVPRGFHPIQLAGSLGLEDVLPV